MIEVISKNNVMLPTKFAEITVHAHCSNDPKFSENFKYFRIDH